MSDSSVSWQLPPLVLFSEQAEKRQTWADKLESWLLSRFVPLALLLSQNKSSRFVTLVNKCEAEFTHLTDAELAEQAFTLKAQLRGHLSDLARVARSFALVREVAQRQLGMRHYDVQVAGAYALLTGKVAEMYTGEGKTLTATLTAATAALAGIPVHVVTVNDYLADRDANTMRPLYQALGLTVGTIVHDLQPEQRQAAYACDITYASNKEITFDYLRDRLALGRNAGNINLKLRRLLGNEQHAGKVVMRGLHFAIVDEADSVLGDEARTPLIISRQTDPADEKRWAEAAMRLVEDFAEDEDYRIIRDERRVELKDAGCKKLAEIGESWGGIWLSRIRREESARQALTALYLFHSGDHYLVNDGKVQIVDEYTGRIMADRSWSEGLHQLVEFKEGCEITSNKVPMARMTYQRFFRRYHRLAGMTGTAKEISGEFWHVYRLPVVRIPTHKPLRRKKMATSLYASEELKWQAIVQRCQELQEAGRPVLIGTRSVLASETLSEKLDEAGMEHVVLSAAQDSDEAGIIAEAGRRGRITVATNMAGRGVDIVMQQDVIESGGLHVILSERHDARRIDRQLEGRCGRQGDPGSTEAILSMDDSVLDIVKLNALRKLGKGGGLPGRWSGLGLIYLSQRRAERAHGKARRDLLQQDKKLGTMLAFTGGRE